MKPKEKFSRKNIAVILARKRSHRLKDKHLIIVDGKPLIQYTFEYALQSRQLDDVVCSTDSDEIASLAESFGIDVIKRPSKFARDDSPIIEAMEYTLLRYGRRQGQLPQTAIILYGNVPYRGSRISQGLELFHKKNADAVFTACEVGKYNPEWMFKTDKTNRMIFDKDTLNCRCQDLPVYYTATDSFIIARTQRLLSRPHRRSLYSDFGDSIFFVEEERNSTIDVDDIYDLNYFRFLVSDKNRSSRLSYWKKGE